MRDAKAIRRAKSAARAVCSPALIAVTLLAGLLLQDPSASAAPPIRFSGELGGLVTDVAGRPQTGAAVLLFNRQDRLLQRSATDSLGTFAFSDLLPDSYSVRVSLSSFVPAIKDRILIKPGMRSLLEVNLSRVFSSVQLVSTTPMPGGLMNDNWKWALRADSSMRPILRFLPVQRAANSPSDSSSSGVSAIFTDSRGLVKISASDGATMSSDGQADLGTQFAFATSLYGGNHLKMAGDVGYASGSSAPSAAIRTTYSRELPSGDKPEISVTMRQVFVPMRLGMGSAQSDGPLPALRTLGVSFDDKKQISDSLRMEYGFAFDSVSFLNSLHYFSPYGKLTYAVPRGTVDFSWTSGNARPELGMGMSDPSADLQRELAAVAELPRVTLMDDHAKVQRGDDFELGFSQRFGSREYRVSGYHERVSNTTLTVASSESGLFPGDLLPDLFSNSSLFNIGKFDTFGYTASVTQDLGENYKLTLIYGSLGVLSPRGSGQGNEAIDTADDLRRIMETGHRPALTLRVSGTVKATGTRLIASYQWTDYQSAVPGPEFSTEATRPEPGLNVILRQPMPAIPRMPWRMEASAELQNLLAQGYLPLTTSGGDQFLLINTPRSIRGGIAFVF